MMTYNNNNNRAISIALVAVLAATLVLAVPASQAVFADHDSGKGKSQDNKDKTKDKKSEKCNNVKIQVKVTDIPEGTDEVSGSITLAGSTVSKTSEIDENETSTTLNFQFKKLSPCPSEGDSFSGSVNGVAIDGTLSSLKKPTKETVSLS